MAGFAIIAAYILKSIPSSHHKLETYPCKTKGQHAGLHLLGIQNATKPQKGPNTVGDVFTSPVFRNVVISLLMLLGAHVTASIISVSGIQYPSSTPGILSYLSSNTSLSLLRIPLCLQHMQYVSLARRNSSNNNIFLSSRIFTPLL